MQKVKIYTTPTCGYCQLAKVFFKENKIDFEEIDIAANPQAADEMVKKTGQMGVPVIIITNNDGKEEAIIGFDKPRLKKVLGIKP